MPAISSSPVAGTEFEHCAESNSVKAQPFVGTSIDNTSDDDDTSIDLAFQAMQRALMRWDIFGTFDCGAEYTLAHARWLRLKGAAKCA